MNLIEKHLTTIKPITEIEDCIKEKLSYKETHAKLEDELVKKYQNKKDQKDNK